MLTHGHKILLLPRNWGPAETPRLLDAVLRIKLDHRDRTGGNFVVNSKRVVNKAKQVMKYVAGVGRQDDGRTRYSGVHSFRQSRNCLPDGSLFRLGPLYTAHVNPAGSSARNEQRYGRDGLGGRAGSTIEPGTTNSGENRQLLVT